MATEIQFDLKKWEEEMEARKAREEEEVNIHIIFDAHTVFFNLLNFLSKFRRGSYFR